MADRLKSTRDRLLVAVANTDEATEEVAEVPPEE